MFVVLRTTLGVITNIVIFFCCRWWDVSTRQNQELEISPSSVAVRKTMVRKPSPPATDRALYSEIMREQERNALRSEPPGLQIATFGQTSSIKR